MIVYLIGLMGAGKSTAGRKLAAKTGWRFADLDSMIESTLGRSISELFTEEGEESFREIEARQLRDITPGENIIVATGGGTPCFHGNMDYMNGTGLTVYLEMTPAALASRLASGAESRPKLGKADGPERVRILEELLMEREPCYKQAKMTIDGLNIDISQLAGELQRQAPYTP